MNTLSLIKDKIQRQENIRRAQLSHVAYRGVEYCVPSKEATEVHGTFCYRGRTYTK